MSLKDVLESFLSEMGWEDEISRDELHDELIIATGVTLGDQGYRTYIQTHEQSQFIKIFMYCPFSVPIERMDVAPVVINRLNVDLPAGHIEMMGDGTVRYRHFVDVENATASAALVQNMLAGACSTFTDDARLKAIGALRFTSAPISVIIEEYEAAQSIKSGKGAH